MAYGANYKEHKPYLHTASKRVIAPSPLSSQFPHFPAFHSSPLSLSPPASHINYNMIGLLALLGPNILLEFLRDSGLLTFSFTPFGRSSGVTYADDQYLHVHIQPLIHQ